MISFETSTGKAFSIAPNPALSSLSCRNTQSKESRPFLLFWFLFLSIIFFCFCFNPLLDAYYSILRFRFAFMCVRSYSHFFSIMFDVRFSFYVISSYILFYFSIHFCLFCFVFFVVSVCQSNFMHSVILSVLFALLPLSSLPLFLCYLLCLILSSFSWSFILFIFLFFPFLSFCFFLRSLSLGILPFVTSKRWKWYR